MRVVIVYYIYYIMEININININIKNLNQEITIKNGKKQGNRIKR